MTVLDLAVHDLVNVRATVIEVYADKCLLGIPIHRNSANGQHRIVLPFSEIVKRDSTMIAWEAMRVAVQLQERSTMPCCGPKPSCTRSARIQPTRSSSLEGLLL
jgi:hypothetical protein